MEIEPFQVPMLTFCSFACLTASAINSMCTSEQLPVSSLAYTRSARLLFFSATFWMDTKLCLSHGLCACLVYSLRPSSPPLQPLEWIRF